MEWVIQQFRETTPFDRKPRYLFRDNDSVYGHGVRKFLDGCNIEEVRTAYRSPFNICPTRAMSFWEASSAAKQTPVH